MPDACVQAVYTKRTIAGLTHMAQKFSFVLGIKSLVLHTRVDNQVVQSTPLTHSFLGYLTGVVEVLYTLFTGLTEATTMYLNKNIINRKAA